MNYPVLRKLLSSAIGGKKAAFAEAANMSPAQLSRLLNQETIPRPTASTLRKICDASQGRISMDSLYKACDYSADEIERAEGAYIESQKRVGKSLSIINHDEAVHIISNFRNGLLQFVGKATRFSSLEDLFHTIDDVYGIPSAHIIFDQAGKFLDNNGFGRYGAEDMLHMTGKWSSDRYVCSFSFVLFICRTLKNGIICSDAAFDLNALIKCNHPGGLSMLTEISTEDGARIDDYPLVFSVKEL